jgi:AcrR family transcriptional regulator/transcriptional regulator with XRE-family HTH domain
MEDSPAGADLGSRVRGLRQEQGLSLRGLAERVGVSAATLSQLETGKSAVRPARVVELARALGVEPEALSPGFGQEPAEGALGGGVDDWRVFEPLEIDPALRAALQCFTATGYHGASVRDIAKRAGLSVPGLYHYYPSKQAMLGAIFDLGMTELLARTRAARDEGEGPLERFCLVVEALTLFHAYRPALSFLGTSEMRALSQRDRRQHARVRTQQQEMVDEEVELGVESGVFRTTQPHEASRAVVTMCVAVANWYRLGGPHTPEDVARQYVGFSLGIVGGDPAAIAR